MIFMSTTSDISNHSKLQHGAVIWTDAIGSTLSEAIDVATKKLQEKAETGGYNAIVDLTQSFAIDASGLFHVLLSGTTLEVEEYPGYAKLREYLKTNLRIEFSKSPKELSDAIKEKAFCQLCLQNDIEKAKKVYELGIDLHKDDDSLFKSIYADVNLDTIKWLYRLGEFDMKQHGNDMFVAVCRNGRLDIVKWLCSTFGISKKANAEEAFIEAVENGQLEVAKWLNGYDGVYITNLESKGIKLYPEYCSTEKEHEMLDWLYSRRKEGY